MHKRTQPEFHLGLTPFQPQAFSETTSTRSRSESATLCRDIASLGLLVTKRINGKFPLVDSFWAILEHKAIHSMPMGTHLLISATDHEGRTLYPSSDPFFKLKPTSARKWWYKSAQAMQIINFRMLFITRNFAIQLSPNRGFVLGENGVFYS